MTSWEVLVLHPFFSFFPILSPFFDFLFVVFAFYRATMLYLVSILHIICVSTRGVVLLDKDEAKIEFREHILKE